MALLGTVPLGEPGGGLVHRSLGPGVVTTRGGAGCSPRPVSEGVRVASPLNLGVRRRRGTPGHLAVGGYARAQPSSTVLGLNPPGVLARLGFLVLGFRVF